MLKKSDLDSELEQINTQIAQVDLSVNPQKKKLEVSFADQTFRPIETPTSPYLKRKLIAPVMCRRTIAFQRGPKGNIMKTEGEVIESPNPFELLQDSWRANIRNLRQSFQMGETQMYANMGSPMTPNNFAGRFKRPKPEKKIFSPVT